ncbi:MAG: XdhC family protein [Gammaproteobacteria bacterium]
MEPLSLPRNEVAIIEHGHAWLAEGERVVLATVAHTWGSSPRPAGAVMVLGESGRFLGSVSGGCIEEELIARLRENFPARFETIEYASDTTRSLPCGGRLLLTLEPLAAVPDLEGLVSALRSGRAVVRHLDLASGRASWEEAARGVRTRLEGMQLDVLYEPTWRLVVIGAGELAQWVCRFALLLDYAVEVCDPRPDYQAAWDVDGLAVASEYPDDFIGSLDCDERTAVVALTHDPKVDDLAIIEALSTRAFYLGALGSRRTTAKRAERLREHFDVSADDLARIHGPVGIDLNSRRPQEIALAVMTDITAACNGVDITTRRRDADA